MDEIRKNLQEAMRNLQIADHMAYLTYPLINEKRILLKIFDNIFKTINNSLLAVLNYESMLERVDVYKDSSINVSNFTSKFSKDYGVDEEQIQIIEEIYEINKRHEESAMEFERKDKMIIMSDDLEIRSMDIDKIKEYLRFAKDFLMKVRLKLKSGNFNTEDRFIY
jgi:hypothetical protein